MFDVSKEFLDENKNNLCQFMPKQKRRGPYSRNEKEKRRDEVYRLHFEYGYSARMISEMMKINRNTINADINYWYGKIIANNRIFDPEQAIVIVLERMNLQRTRMMETLSRSSSLNERIQIEKVINDIDYRIVSVNHKLAESARRVYDLSIHHANKMLDAEKSDKRVMTLFDKIRVSEKSREQINKIINENSKRAH